MGRNKLNTGRGLDPKVRYQVIPDRRSLRFLVWDTKLAKPVGVCQSRVDAERLRDKKNKKV